MQVMMGRLVMMVGAAVLGGCSGDPSGRDATDQRGAEGEVLGGTISDGMIPVEAVKSQSPVLRPAAASADGPGETEGEGEGTGAEALAAPPPGSSAAPADPAE